MFKVVSLSLTFAFPTGLAVTQTKELPPFQIKLLPGYRIEPSTSCVDTRCGQIVKPWAPTVEYDMGGDLPGAVDDTRPVEAWRRECSWSVNIYSDDSQPKGGNGDVVCSLEYNADTRKKTLHTSFPDGTSLWVVVKTHKQMRRFLKMFLTYDPRAASYHSVQ